MGHFDAAERAPLRNRAIIRVAGKEAELMLNDDFSWACGDAELENWLNKYLRQAYRATIRTR